jgi:hypothetical protein
MLAKQSSANRRQTVLMTLRLIETLRWWKTVLKLRYAPTHPNMIELAPPLNRGMTDRIDKSAFKKSLPVLAARVPVSKTAEILRSPEMKKCVWIFEVFLRCLRYVRSLLSIPRVRSVVYDPTDPNGDRLVLLKVVEEGAPQHCAPGELLLNLEIFLQASRASTRSARLP